MDLPKPLNRETKANDLNSANTTIQMDLPKPLNREIKANDLFSANTTLIKLFSR